MGYGSSVARRKQLLTIVVVFVSVFVSVLVTIALGFMVRTGRLRIGQAGCVGAECPVVVTTTSPGQYQIIYSIKNDSDLNASFNLEVDSKSVSAVQAIASKQSKKYQYNVSYKPGTQVVLKVTSGSLTILGFEVVDQPTSKVLLSDAEVNSNLVANEVNNFYSVIYPDPSSISNEPVKTRESVDNFENSNNSFVATESLSSETTIQATTDETIRVLELRYFPREADVRRTKVNAEATLYKTTMINASKPKGYKNAAAVPSVNVQVIKTIERLQHSPRVTGQFDTWYHSLDAILTANNNELCNEIVNNKIDQVWAWFDTGYDTGGYDKEYQWVYSNDLYEYQYTNGASSGAPNLCGGKRSFGFLGLDQNLDVAFNGLHSFGHAAEDHLGKLLIPKLFWVPFTGTTSWDRPAPVCGNVHYPPNGTAGDGLGYDYDNTATVSTSCINWKPDGSGVPTQINCTQWGCTQLGYINWWAQNWPNKANGLTFEGKALPNWWQFFYNIDQNIAQMISTNQYLDSKVTNMYFKTPTTSSPPNGYQHTDASPTFYWYDTRGATGYTIQVSTTPAFTTFLVNATSTTPVVQYTTTVEFPKSTTLYWRVRGNAGTASTAWSPTVSFTSANAITNKPTLTSPATNTILPATANLKPVLKWQTAFSATIPAPQKFDIQIATTNTFTEDTIKVNLTNQSVPDDVGGTAVLQKKILNTTSTLENATTYFWKVRSRAANGHTGSWSTVFSFRTPIETVSSLSQPSNNATINTARPTFQWGGVINATSYTIMYTTVQPVLPTTVFTALGTVPGTTNQFTPTADLLRNKTYTWKIKATNTLYGTSLSSPSTFTSSNHSNIPTLTKPVTNTVTTGTDPLRPILEWKTAYSTSIPKPVSYDIQVTKNEDTTFTNLVINKSNVVGTAVAGSTTILEIRNWQIDSALQNLTQYSWRVRSKNAAGQTSAWSTPFVFKTPIQTVGTLSSPGSNSTATTITPTFDWSDAQGATSYTVEAQIAPATTWAVLGTSTTSTWTPAAAGLQRNKVYTWRVKATNAAFVTTSISGTSTFTSANPPATPVLALPAANAIIATPTTTLTWTQPATAGYAVATRYQIQIATDAAFNFIVNQSSSVTTSSYSTPALSPGTTYYWRVKGFSAQNHETPWTLGRVFKTPPGLVSLMTTTTQKSDSQSISLNHVYSGAGRYLVVAVSYHTSDSSGKVQSMSYGGVNMNIIRKDAYHEYYTEIWTLPQNAAPTNTSASVNFSGPTDSHIVTAMTFINVMGGTPLRVAAGNGTGAVPSDTLWGSQGTHPLTVTSATTDLALGVHTSFAGGYDNDATMTGGTLVRNERYNNVISTIYTRIPTTTSASFSFSVKNNYPWSASGLSLRSR